MSEPAGLSRRPVYLDHHATTPVDPRVLQAMLPYFTEAFGNAASIDHEYGREAAAAVEEARDQVSGLINARPEEIIFTSGATEADNLAILGVAEQYGDQGRHIVTCVTEHKAVLDSCHYLERRGWAVTYLPVDQQGMVDLDDLRRAMRPDTVLITVMAANNEIGVLAPLIEIGAIAREYGVLFHTDATQATGHIPVDAQAANIDLLSMSAHKVYGPKGVGALYVRKARPRVKVAAQTHGGGHERGMRSGTLNVPGIVGLGAALKIAGQEMAAQAQRLQRLRDRLRVDLEARVGGVELNGHPARRLPHNLNIAIEGVRSRALLIEVRHDLALSAGSACTTLKVEPSHVILALGYDEERARCCVRIGLGRENTDCDVDFAVDTLAAAIRVLRRFA